MQISFSGAAEEFHQIPKDRKDIVGYSNAIGNIFREFEKFDINCSVNDPSAAVGIGMGYPTDYKFFPHQYRIGYTAWESTQLQHGWFDIMNNCHDIWATSSWTARVFKKQLDRDVFVYPHGIGPSWTPLKRSIDGPFRFLHVGEPQIRKNGQLVVDAFVEQFGKDPNFELILKSGGMNTTRIYGPDGSIIGSPDAHYENIRIINEQLTHEQMVRLYHLCNALVYPTAGEGFGFIPLQALATGMPTISTWQWAEYKDFITIKLRSSLGETIHEVLHPGMTYNPTKEDLKISMQLAVDNYDEYAHSAFTSAPLVHKEFDWEYVSKPAIKRLKNIFKSRGLG